MTIRPTRVVKAAGSGLRRLARGRRPHLALRALQRLGSGLLSARFVITLCTGLMVMQLVVLGIGICGRMEQAARLDLDVARMNMAAIEAQGLARALSGSRASSISASSGNAPAANAPAADAQPEQSDDPNEAPPLQPRTVETILAEDAGMDLISARMEDDAELAAELERSDSADDGADSGPTTQDEAEVDELIRSGVAAMIEGDVRRSILNFQAAYEINPNHPALLYYYGMAYDKLLNPDKAREYYMRVFRMRDRAGRYFERASRRLTFGMARPSDMRGKLSFGPHRTQHSYDPETGESVRLLIPVLLASGEEVLPEDIKIEIQMFDLVNGRKIEFNRLAEPEPAWEHEAQTFSDGEENLLVSYRIPPLTIDEQSVYGDVRYYGFTAKLLYKGEPLDCISSPSALILHEQILNNKRRIAPGGLLPDDGLNYEEALPVSDFLYEQGTAPEAIENIPTELPDNPS